MVVWEIAIQVKLFFIRGQFHLIILMLPRLPIGLGHLFRGGGQIDRSRLQITVALCGVPDYAELTQQVLRFGADSLF